MKTLRVLFLFIQFTSLICGKSVGLLPQKVIVCGVCQNVANQLICVKKIMERIGELFVDYRIIVYENNSIDATKKKLLSWAKKNSKVFISSDVLKNCEISHLRTERIACARNKVLEILISEKYNEFNYVIWVDMDFVLEPDYKGFLEVFASGKTWDAVFANGIQPNNTCSSLPRHYYDSYAFRDKNCPLGPELHGWDHRIIFKHFNFVENSDWFPVYSAFGGCGIYKKDSIRGCRYSGKITEDLMCLYKKIILEFPSNLFVKKYLNSGIFCDEVILARVVCEHVPFHASMIARGHNQLFINPRLIFRYLPDSCYNQLSDFNFKWWNI